MNYDDFLNQTNEPWVRYGIFKDLLRLEQDDPRLIIAKEEMMDHPLIRQLILELEDWPGTVLSSHKSANQSFHKLEFLADLGVTKDDFDSQQLKEKIMSHRSEEGLFQLPMAIPVHFGGTGVEQWSWALCDTPLISYALLKMKIVELADMQVGIDYLLDQCRDNGWPCKLSKEVGSFRGPGKKADPCPYVNLIMLKLLTQLESQKNGPQATIALECLLNLWDKSQELHPYMFFMGTDFRKLKAPFIWYDILHVTDVLSQYPQIHSDPRFLDMISVIGSKVNDDGRYTAESVWMALKGWDFSNKKQPSNTLTFFIERLRVRMGCE